MPRPAAILLLCVALGCARCAAHDSAEEAALVEWLAARGAEVHFTIGRACPSCPRGALAARALQPGDVVAAVPAAASIPLGSASVPRAALALLKRQRLDPAFNASFGPYLAALPRPGQVFAAELFSADELQALQTPELERLVRRKLEDLDAAHCQAPALGLPGLAREELAHMAALVRTRNFYLLGQQRLVPAFDILNHSEQPNTQYSNDGKATLLLRATRAIAAGEELTDSYMQGVLHRPDAALFHYGFLPLEADLEARPLLPAVDLPSYWALKPWARTAASDEAYVPTAAGSWASDYVLGREHARLTALLAAMPTSEAQDAALLAAGEPRGWRQQLAVQFCLCRKRALRLALEQMEGAWAAAHPGDVVANASAAADAAEHCQLALGSSSLEHSAAAGAAAAACPLPASHSSARGMSRLRALLAQAAGEAVYAARMWDWQPACVPLLLGAAALAVVRRGQYAF